LFEVRFFTVGRRTRPPEARAAFDGPVVPCEDPCSEEIDWESDDYQNVSEAVAEETTAYFETFVVEVDEHLAYADSILTDPYSDPPAGLRARVRTGAGVCSDSSVIAGQSGPDPCEPYRDATVAAALTAAASAALCAAGGVTWYYLRILAKQTKDVCTAAVAAGYTAYLAAVALQHCKNGNPTYYPRRDDES
jgi:hypothetical protein